MPFAAPAAADEGSTRLATLRARPPTHDITALALLLISTLHDRRVHARAGEIVVASAD